MKSTPPAPPLESGARRYVAATVAVAAAAAAAALVTDAAAGPVPDGGELAAFLALGLGAAFAQFRVIEIRANHGFPASIAFLVAGALLLPPALVALLAVAQYLPEVYLRRTPWSIQAFNVSNGTLNVLAAWLVAREVGDAILVAGVAAALAFVLLNHLLLAGALRLARGHSLRASGLFSVESVGIDAGLALVGVAAVGLAGSSVVLVPVALAPLLLAHRLLRLLAALRTAEPEPQPEPS